MTKINKNPTIKSVKEVCDIIFSLEEKYDLNHMKIQGVYAWQLVRIYVYYEISRRIGVFGSPQQGKVTLKDKVFSFLPFIKNSLFSNPLSGNYHKDILIFDHPRKVIYNEKYKDIYSYFLINDLLETGNSYEVIESPYLNKHYTKKEDYIKYNDRILLGSYIYKKLSNLKLKSCERDKIANIQRELISNFDIEIDLFNIITNHILDFKYHYKKYDKLFKKRTPKYVFVVVAYENQAMIAAAKDNDVEVIELQHGTISKYHLGYNYPNPQDKNLKYFPDKILSFGEYWKTVASYPIDEKNIISIGFPYLEETIESYINNEKNKKQILFISQGVIGKYLSDFAYNLAKRLEEKEDIKRENIEKEDIRIEDIEKENIEKKDIEEEDINNNNNNIEDDIKIKDKYSIIYKLHPGEYSNWENNYKNLKEASELSNFTVIDNSNVSLYELFSKSEYQVGVFSTAIYEGLLFDCKTFLVNLPGVEYMDSLVNKNYVKKINDIDEFIDSSLKFKIDKYNRDLFFKKYDKSVLKKLVDNNKSNKSNKNNENNNDNNDNNGNNNYNN